MSSRFEYDDLQSEVIASERIMSSGSEINSGSFDVSASLLDGVLAIAQQEDAVRSLLQWLPGAVIKGFGLQDCQIELYDAQQQAVTLVSGRGGLETANQSQEIKQFWEFYQPLTQGKSLQFSSQTFRVEKMSANPLTWLGCPMMKPTGLMGNVWLARSGGKIFNPIETDQLQQVVNCVAIALHQSQLQQTIDTQKTEIYQLRQAKDEFLQLISHELFVPLGNIQLSTQTLEKIFKDPSWRKVPQRNTVLKVLSLLSQECRRQKLFVDNLITLMFPEYQKTSEPVLMNLSDWLPSLLRPFEARFEQESLTLKTNIPDGPLLFECDVAQLERIIIELVNNAIKYTPAKKTVMVTVNADAAGSEIAIANTGVHIPPQHQAKIFEKFYRVPELDQRQYGGSGLGLALAKQLVTNLDGTIEVKSTKQKTTFTVKLPR